MCAFLKQHLRGTFSIPADLFVIGSYKSVMQKWIKQVLCSSLILPYLYINIAICFEDDVKGR